MISKITIISLVTDKIESRSYDSDMDVLLFENKNTGSRRRANLMDVSLYDDIIIEDNDKFKIISMLSK